MVIGKKDEDKDEIRDSEINIPLNRLNELPEKIAEMIEPVLLPNDKWSIRENIIYWFDPSMGSERNTYLLDEIEIEIFKYLSENQSIKQISKIISNNRKWPYLTSYQKVTTFFFKLASISVCYPKNDKQIYDYFKNEND
jgi:hypothetical protein